MSGAEVMAHRMAKELVKKGHDVTVICPWEDKIIDGVKVVQNDPNDEIFKAADLVFTHLIQTADTFNKSRAYSKKVIHIIHNSWIDGVLKVRVLNNYLVYNSEWIISELGYEQEGIVLNPPVDYREYEKVNSKAKYVTLVNLNENKGGQILIDIAKRLPHIQFLGVEGGYYDQIKEDVKNIKYVPQTKDIKTVLKDTKILLAPSQYESWGQIGIEAASAGIPVIANPTPGLKASLKEAGIYADRDNIDEWVEKIEALQNPETYKEWSVKAKNRAVELDPLPQLEAFEKWLQWVHKQPYK
ncbi:glycosyltransferase family 4 protein [Pedobacter sp.]|uniref:glycosyltransferase family 4 protein n=1 Tax=Pedobacter sp. TaxID=1411316 RepID=UPI003C3EB8E4